MPAEFLLVRPRLVLLVRPCLACVWRRGQAAGGHGGVRAPALLCDRPTEWHSASSQSLGRGPPVPSTQAA